MKRKKLSGLFFAVMILSLMVVLVCISQERCDDLNYEQAICENAKACTRSIKKEIGFETLRENEYKVRYIGTELDLYEIYYKSNEPTTVGFPVGEKMYLLMEEIEPAGKKEQKLAEKSKEKVIKYIKNSKVLKEKEEIIDFIQNIPVMVSNFEDSQKDVGAVFYDIPDVGIYINRYNLNYLCDWTLVHELVHAISYITHGKTLDYPYSTSSFNEVLTDIITASMKPKMIDGMESGYSMGYPYLYVLMDTIGVEKSLKCYFTIWDEEITGIPSVEINLYERLINAYCHYGDPQLHMHIMRILSKWRSAI